MRDFLMDGGNVWYVDPSGPHSRQVILDRATPLATPMSKEDTAPPKENEREPEDESDSILRELKVVRLVLEIIKLVAQLISML
jgi:hypothetical protein